MSKKYSKLFSCSITQIKVKVSDQILSRQKINDISLTSMEVLLYVPERIRNMKESITRAMKKTKALKYSNIL